MTADLGRGAKAALRRDLSGPVGLAVALIASAVKDSVAGDLSAWMWVCGDPDNWLATLGGALDVDIDVLRRRNNMELDCKTFARWRSRLDDADRHELDKFIALVSNEGGRTLSADELGFIRGVADKLALLAARDQGELGAALAGLVSTLRQLLEGKGPVTNRAPPVLLAHRERRGYTRQGPAVLTKNSGREPYQRTRRFFDELGAADE